MRSFAFPSAVGPTGSMPASLGEGSVVVLCCAGHVAAAGLKAGLAKVKMNWCFRLPRHQQNPEPGGQDPESKRAAIQLGRRQVPEPLPLQQFCFSWGLFWKLCLSQFKSW